MDISHRTRRPPPPSLPSTPVAGMSTPARQQTTHPLPVPRARTPQAATLTMACASNPDNPADDPALRQREARINTHFHIMIAPFAWQSDALLDIRTYAVKGKTQPVLAGVFASAAYAYGAELNVEDFVNSVHVRPPHPSPETIPQRIDDLIHFLTLKAFYAEASENEDRADADLPAFSSEQINQVIQTLESGILNDLEHFLRTPDAGKLVEAWLCMLGMAQGSETFVDFNIVTGAFRLEVEAMMAGGVKVGMDPNALVKALVILMSVDRLDCWNGICIIRASGFASGLKSVIATLLGTLSQMVLGVERYVGDGSSQGAINLMKDLAQVKNAIPSSNSRDPNPGDLVRVIIDQVTAEVVDAGAEPSEHWKDTLNRIGTHAYKLILDLCQPVPAGVEEVVVRV